jgi:hypothetical protein
MDTFWARTTLIPAPPETSALLNRLLTAASAKLQFMKFESVTNTEET